MSQLIFTYEIEFIKRVSSTKTKVVEYKKALEDLDKKPQHLEKYFRKFSYINAKFGKKYYLKYKKIKITETDKGVLLNIHFNVNENKLKLSMNELIKRVIKHIAEVANQKWLSVLNDTDIKVDTSIYYLDLDDEYEPLYVTTKDGIMFTSKQKQSKQLRRQNDYQEDVFDEYFYSIPGLPMNMEDLLLNDMIIPKSLNINSKAIEEFQNNFDYYHIGNCTNTIDPVSGTILANLEPYRIVHLIDHMTGYVTCYDVITLFQLFKLQGYAYNPLTNNKLSFLEKDRLTKQFLINGLYM